MIRFKGSVEHTKDTIHVLYKTTYEIYEPRRVILRMFVGFLMVIAGIFLTLPMIIQGILFMGGTWLMVSRDFPAKIMASEALEKRGDNLPTLITEFHERFMMLQDGSSIKLQYKDIEHLVEEEKLIILFFSKDSAVVISKDTLEGGTLEEFMAFLEKITNLPFRKIQSWFRMSIRDLYRLMKKS